MNDGKVYIDKEKNLKYTKIFKSVNGLNKNIQIEFDFEIAEFETRSLRFLCQTEEKEMYEIRIDFKEKEEGVRIRKILKTENEIKYSKEITKTLDKKEKNTKIIFFNETKIQLNIFGIPLNFDFDFKIFPNKFMMVENYSEENLLEYEKLKVFYHI
jgi:hypothetical protein